MDDVGYPVYYLFLSTHFYSWVITLFLLRLQEFVYIGDIDPSDADFLCILLAGSFSPIKKYWFVLGIFVLFVFVHLLYILSQVLYNLLGTEKIFVFFFQVIL